MNVPLFFLLGLWLAGVQDLSWRVSPLAPWLLPLLLSVVLLRSPAYLQLQRVLPLLLGCAALSLDSVGAFLLGGGLVAVVLLPVRDFVYVERWQVQVGSVLIACGMLGVARSIAVLVGAEPGLPWTGASLTGPVLSALLAPVAHRLWEAFDRFFPRLQLVTPAPGQGFGPSELRER